MRRAIFAAALLVAVSARADDKKELQDVELAIEKARYQIPSPSIVDFKDLLQRKAARAKVTIEIAPAPPYRWPLADGKPSPVEMHPMEISGRGDPADAQIFLAFATSPVAERVVLESLRMTAQAGGNVAWRARLAMAYWNADSPTIDFSRGPDAAIHQMLLRQRAVLDTLKSLDQRVASQRRILGAVARFQSEAHANAIALTEIRSDGETHLDGVLLGTAAREALKPALAKGGFSVTRIDFAPRGDCHAFAATAQTTDAVAEHSEFGAMNVFYAGADAACTSKQASAIPHATAAAAAT